MRKKKKIIKSSYFIQKGLRTPLGTIFIPPNENEIVDSLLIHSSIRDLCSNSNELYNYIKKLTIGESENEHILDFIMDDNLCWMMGFISKELQKEFLKNCFNIIKAGILKEELLKQKCDIKY